MFEGKHFLKAMKVGGCPAQSCWSCCHIVSFLFRLVFCQPSDSKKRTPLCLFLKKSWPQMANLLEDKKTLKTLAVAFSEVHSSYRR